MRNHHEIHGTLGCVSAIQMRSCTPLLSKNSSVRARLYCGGSTQAIATVAILTTREQTEVDIRRAAGGLAFRSDYDLQIL
jgi:hypothetical protein